MYLLGLRAMKLGVNPGYVFSIATPAQELEFAVEAERLGLDSLWVGEPYGHEAVSVLAWFAGATERIGLGSSILAMPGRSAAMTAQAAATLDHIGGQRLVLGLGTSGPQVSEGWHGVPFAHQLQRTREYVDVVRMALRREVVRYDGKTIALPLPGGEGKPLKMIIRPPRAEVPIYLASIGPRNTELCGEIADGWIPIWYAPEHAARLREPLATGAACAGRSTDDIAIAPMVYTRIDEDLDAARDALRPHVALYVGGMGSRRHNFYNALVSSYGFEAAAALIQDLYLDGRKDDAAARVPDELVDMVCLCGSVERVADRLAAYADAGVDTVISSPVATSAEDRLQQLRLLARAGARSAVAAGT
jgi:F420-dependent oxidoreductase-like protein